jgi:succinate dehydrogenase/fumarate reductase cytochrome b subunit
MRREDMIGRESYFWHKLHSLTGMIPTGFYLVQHLTLNSFALGGPEKFNGVIQFFEGMPKHLFSMRSTVYSSLREARGTTARLQ